MPAAHSYVTTLADKVLRHKRQQISLTVRALLRGFGYERRTETVVDTIAAALHTLGLDAALSLVFPHSLDEKVTISTLNPQAPTVSPAPALPIVQVDLRVAAARALPATVAVQTDSGIGSGFIIHPDGLVVTARHVVEEDGSSLRSVQVTLMAGSPNERTVEGLVVQSHRQLDYALLWLLDDGPFPTLPIGAPQMLAHGQIVLTIGCPSGLHNTVSHGIISNPCQFLGGIEYIQTDAAIDPGNSGGPLIADDGVVGINMWILMGVGAAKFALPIDYLADEIVQACTLGRAACLAAVYCPACGNLDLAPQTWFCRSCGMRFTPHEDLAVALAT